jgi:hydrophobic/amphiphilic exporter-1 (mainly G- bacteria), HAE1 family
MQRSTLQHILDRPVAVSMGLGALLVGGIFALTQLPLDLAPTLEYPALTVRTSWGGASPEAVEVSITAPIEELAGTLRGVRRVASESSEAESSVSIEFDPATEMQFSRLQLYELLAAFNERRPAGAQPPIIEPYVPADLRELQGFISYSLVGPYSARELRRIAEEIVLPRITSVRGVGSVTIYGGLTRQIAIEVDRRKAAMLAMTPAKLQQMIGAISSDVTLGALSSNGQRMVITSQASNQSVAGIGQIPLMTTSNGTLVRLKDLAVIRDVTPEPTSRYRINGMPSVTLVVDKEQSVNLLSAASEVFGRVEEISKALPKGCLLIKETDQSTQMRQEIRELTHDMLFSVASLWVILMLFLGNWRAPLFVLASILFSVAGTLAAFGLLSIGLNFLTIGGLALGFGRLVDDSIVVYDCIQRNAGVGSRRDAVTVGVRQIALPVFASTLTTIGALVPTAFLPLELRLMFGGFAAAVSLSLLFSLVISFTVVPLAMSRSDAPWKTPQILVTLGAACSRTYRQILRWVLTHRKTAIGFVLWCFGVPLWLLPPTIEQESWLATTYNATVGSDFYMSIRPVVDNLLGGSSQLFFAKVHKGELWSYGKETFLTVSIAFPAGTEMARYDTVAQRIESEVRSQDSGVTKVTTKLVPDQALFRVEFTDSAATTALPYSLKERLTVLGEKIGGAAVGVYGFGPGFYTGSGGGGGTFTVRVLGYNYLKVRSIAEDLRSRLARNPRVARVDIDRSYARWDKSYELAAIVDRAAIARTGLTVIEVIRAIRQNTVGAIGYDLVNVENTRIPCSVKLAGYREFSVRDLEAATVLDAKGNPVRIGSLVHFEQRQVPSEIRRENQEYLRFVTFDYMGQYNNGRFLLDKTLQGMRLPAGYRFESQQGWFLLAVSKQKSLLIIALFALLIVFMVTASLYESLRTPMVVILAVPFSLIGLFLAFYLTGTPFGRGGYASVILLIGIVVSNSIVLADHISERVRREGPKDEVLVQAASDRLRPIFMTSIATIAGLLPLLIGGDKSGVWYSLALGTIGGLSSSTILTLTLIPMVMMSQAKRNRDAADMHR